MRHPSHRVAVAAALACARLASDARAAEPPKVAQDTAEAFQEFDRATEQLKGALAALAAIEAGDTPKGLGRNWAGAIAGYEAAARIIKESAGPSVPEARAFTASPEHLKACSSRSAALARMAKQIEGLQSASQRAAEARATVKARLEAAQAAEDARRDLVKRAERLSGAPLLAQHLTWRPEDPKRAERAISVYAGELERQLDGVEKGNAELKLRSARLAELSREFGKSRDCLLAGSWSGSKSQGTSVSAMTLRLAGSWTTWSGEALLDGGVVPVRSVSVSGRHVAIVLRGGSASLKGMLSPDGTSYRGTLSTMQGPGSFALTKQ